MLNAENFSGGFKGGGRPLNIDRMHLKTYKNFAPKCVIFASNFQKFSGEGAPQQIETWLLFTAYKKSSAPYPIVPSPTPYDLLFSHNTSVTDRQWTNDRRQPSHRCIIQHTCSCSTSETDSE